MESMFVKNDGSDDERNGGSSTESLSGWLSEYRSSSNTSEKSSSVSTLVGWPLPLPPPSLCHKTEEHLNFKKSSSKFSEMEVEMMKDRFAKLLLGEDMSGSGNGVCPALALSNAITNLCATVFGQLWRLEPLTCEKKLMWQREMEFLLFVTGHIVEFIPSVQTCPDGTKLEVMTSRPRSDILINLPALRKLDNMLLGILDSFAKKEFWYIDQGPTAPEANGSASFRQSAHYQDKKWRLPVPRVPPAGLVENTRTELIKKRDCAAQILKAAMSIHTTTLAEMEIPESYIETLQKNAKACLGDMIYRCITSEQFSSECLLDCLDLSSQHFALEIANRVEASIHVWQRRLHHRTQLNANRSTTKSSWDIVKDIMNDGDKVELLAERAENLLLCLKQRFPSLGQTALETSKVHCNKDVGKAILESYSRILASVASNIVSRIDDLLSVDDLTKYSENIPPARIVTQKHDASKPGTKISSPRFSAISPLLSPTKRGRRPLISCNNSKQLSHDKGVSATTFLLSPTKRDRRPFLNCHNNKILSPSKGVKRVSACQNVGEERVKNCINLFEGLGTLANRNGEIVASRKSL